MHAPTLNRRNVVVAGLGWLAAARVAARPSAAPLLAREGAPGVDPAGYLVSEKFDGVRALWDGRTLRFRSGQPIPAPAWFASRLPPLALDGELWLRRGSFEILSGVVRRQRADDAAWREVRYLLFELPGGAGTFAERARRLQQIARDVGWTSLQAIEQEAIDGRATLQRRLQQVLEAGGEGLMLHRADAAYVGGRNAALLKVKPQQDAEATVLAHLPGQGRLEGLAGALRVREDSGTEFVLGSGLSDAVRASPPPVGARVTFTYLGRTHAGVPRFASYLRLAGP